MTRSNAVLTLSRQAGPEHAAEVLSITHQPVPKPGDGEVLVRLYLRSVNSADARCVTGQFAGYKPKSYPASFGNEGVGKIEELGEGVSSRLSVGQRVIGVTWGAGEGLGTYQQYRVVKEDILVPVPDSVPDHFAASAVVNPATVLGLIEKAAVPAGGYLLTTAAGSALNLLVLQLAISRGIKAGVLSPPVQVIGTVRRPEARDALLKKGFSEIVVTKEGEGLADAVKAATGGKGAHAALDSIAGPIIPHIIDSLADGGKLIIYGRQSLVHVFSANANDLHYREISLHGFFLGGWFRTKTIEQQRGVLEDILNLYQQGVFKTEPGEEYPLEEAANVLFKQFNVGQEKKVFLKG